MISRETYRKIWSELSGEKSMVFLAGPRQVGKTTLAQMIAKEYSAHLYFNWDRLPDRAQLLKDPLFFTRVPRRDASRPLVILDEIHKYNDWKNYLKGVYDQFHDEYQFLVLGSGRLDIHQRGGDSLAGRYFLFHLWPLTLAELGGQSRSLDDFLRDPLALPAPGARPRGTWNRLLAFSGFPEPFVKSRAVSWQRWSQNYHRQLIREDIRDLVALNNIQGAENLFLLLPGKVGAPLSLNNLAGDLKVAFNTVKAWLDVFERFFLAFRIAPWTRKLSRAIQKEKKLYVYDLPVIPDPGARFENAVALELHRALSNWNELGLGQFSLHYLRNKEKQEVDFLLAVDQEPFLLVETKLADRRPSSALLKFQSVFNVPAVQLVHEGNETFQLVPNGKHRVLVAPAWRWLPGLP